MIFGYFILLVALLISTVAEYYSIAGLVAIFSAAPIPVIVMGASLAVGKIVSTVWLKVNWHRVGWQFKMYLIPAIVFLMLLTSMGIFGFLSKAHSDQSLVSGDSQAKVAIYDEKIKTARDNIEANRRALKQMDEAVDQVMGRSADERGAERAVQIRRNQKVERDRLLKEIATEQKNITQLNEQRAPLAAEFRKVESEVGPIKYIAALIYGDNPDQNILEKAVRLVIILIVLVFDPLALVLILAGNKQLDWARSEKQRPVPELTPDQDKLYSGITENQEAFSMDSAAERAESVPSPKIVELEVGKVDHYEDPSRQPSAPAEAVDQFAYLKQPFAHFKDTKPLVAQPESTKTAAELYSEQESLDTEAAINTLTTLRGRTPEMDEITQRIAKDPKFDLANVAATFSEAVAAPAAKVVEYHSDSNAPVRQVIHEHDLSPVADNAGHPVNADFGTAFPQNPNKGDMYLRVDYLPNKLFRYNGIKWIELDKSVTDTYAFNDEYIKFLIDKINSGEYSVEDLSETEQEQIRDYLSK